MNIALQRAQEKHLGKGSKTLLKSVSEPSPLRAAHKQNAARMIDYAGFRMPLHFGSQIAEHVAVRNCAGMFDISHTRIVDLHGVNVLDWLRKLLVSDVAKLSDGGAQYSCMCRPDGGVVDDLVVFRLAADHFRITLSGATHQKSLAWLNSQRPADVEICKLQDTAFIAVQGPDAVSRTSMAFEDLGRSADLLSMDRFTAQITNDWFVARTGYTGEDGVEIALPSSDALPLWNALAEQGVTAAGLGARNTLRLEAGLALSGRDLDSRHSPVESGIGHTIDTNDPDREFIGREILEDHKLFGGSCLQIGIVLEGRGVLKHGQVVERVGREIGRITSGSFSPSKEVSIALARVNQTFKGGCDVQIGEQLVSARITSVPFLPHNLAL